MTPELTPETPEWVTKKFNEGVGQQAPAQPQQELPPVDAYSNMTSDEDLDLPY